MNDRVAVVAGGSRGLGLLIARELVGRGFRVAVAARNAVMRLTPPRLALRSMARYADWRPPPLP